MKSFKKLLFGIVPMMMFAVLLSGCGQEGLSALKPMGEGAELQAPHHSHQFGDHALRTHHRIGHLRVRAHEVPSER